MPRDFIPSREADLVTWSANFFAKINSTPTAFGLVAGQATSYGTLNTAFVTAYNVANDPLTRSPANIITKDQAKANLIANARLLAGIVQKFPTITNTQRAELGLTVHAAGPSPIPAPANSPQILIESTVGNTVKIRLVDSDNPTRRGRPAGVDGASVFSFVGAVAPTDESGWKFEGNTTKMVVDVTFPNTVAPGAKVWFTSFYFNPRAQSGPGCSPVGTNIPGGSAMAA